jgi:2'-5' RNA ligase
MKTPGAQPSQAIRAFVAIALPPELKDGLSELQEQLRQRLHHPPAFRWTEAGQVHLTVKFLGHLLPEIVPQLRENLAKAVAGFSPFELSAASLGFFPDQRKPRVCWVGIEGDLTVLQSLQENVDGATEPWVPREKKTFAPHLTLARVKQADRALAEQLAAVPETLWRCRIGNWRVTELDLMQSELLPQGARHTQLAALPFSSVSV